ncbi:PAS domain-containing sensor histidine kinase [Dyadobacter sp. 3J3]|uniref:PAS domain-containing sensor histidine kinase n=1 Tax=Dyadobacter sp. 3J3 TaxID=2606600 RepID=UPI00135A2113|nr:PAS domain-containing sensor histidine kinase [Dyadobacter sp. 3J3]
MISDPKSNDAELTMIVVDQISAMIAYWDKELMCQFANAPYLKWFGKKKEDMVGRITIRELLGPKLYEMNLPYIQAVLNGKVQTFEREITLPNGDKRFTLANYFPDIENGEVKGFFVQVADIHDLKLLEKDLTLSNQIVSDQNKRLHNFANIVSHNLKSYSSNLASLLQMLHSAESEEEKNEIIRYLTDLSNGFSGTVNHLTEIVSVQNLRDKDHVACNLLSFINKIIEILKIQIENSGAVIRHNINPELILHTNPIYLESIILNLLTNALKYRHPGRPPLIELNARTERQQIVFQVKDNGLGIDLKKYGTHLFEMNQTFHGNQDANGIGLYITKYQIESLGGFIEVASEVDAGSTFSVYFKGYEAGVTTE